MKTIKLLASLVVPLALFSCGGGGGSSQAETPTPASSDLAIQIPFTSIYIDSLNKADTTVFDTRNSLYNTLRIKYNMVDSNYLYTL